MSCVYLVNRSWSLSTTVHVTERPEHELKACLSEGGRVHSFVCQTSIKALHSVAVWSMNRGHALHSQPLFTCLNGQSMN